MKNLHHFAFSHMQMKKEIQKKSKTHSPSLFSCTHTNQPTNQPFSWQFDLI